MRKSRSFESPRKTKHLGKKFGVFTVIGSKSPEKGKATVYIINCPNGTEKTVENSSLFRGSKHCLCLLCLNDKYKNKKFNQLTILKVISKESKNEHPYLIFKTICECGIIKNLNSKGIIQGSTISCGCTKGVKLKLKITDNEMTVNEAWYHFKYGAKTRNLNFELTKEEISTYIFNPCYYCGRTNVSNRKYGARFISRNGIDRVDNLKGYSLENTVTCCKDCNKMKMSLSQQKFIELIHKISKNLGGQ